MSNFYSKDRRKTILPIWGTTVFVSAIALFLAMAIFVLDLLTPLGVAGGVPYVALVFVGWWFPNRRMIIVLAALASGLTVAGYFHSPDGGISWVVLTNRAYALFAIWITALAIWIARRSRALVLQKEAKLKESIHRAQAANIAKSEFLATVSHELRTPLNAINGFTDTMLREIFGPISNDTYKEYIQFIQRSGNHLKELITDVLDVSAIDAGKLELNEKEMDAKKLIERAVRMVSPRSELRNVSIRASIPDDLPVLYVDPQRVHEIQLNILSNAIKFSHEGGEISLNAQVNTKGCFEISVQDNGIGMNEEELSRAIDRFGRVESSLTRNYDGVGLGLPLSKALTELHGGNFDITSKKGIGTSVMIELPKERIVQRAC